MIDIQDTMELPTITTEEVYANLNDTISIFDKIIDFFVDKVKKFMVNVPIILEEVGIYIYQAYLIDKITKWKSQILKLENNWDGENGIPINPDVINNTEDILLKIFEKLVQNQIYLDVPLVSPLPDGSLDLHFQTENFELLINFMSDDSGLVSLYGDNYKDIKLETIIPHEKLLVIVIDWIILVTQ